MKGKYMNKIKLNFGIIQKLKKYIKKSNNKDMISKYLKFLYRENRFHELISEYKKFERYNKDIEIPEFLREFV